MEQAGTTAASPVRAALDGLQLNVATGTLVVGIGRPCGDADVVARDGLEGAQRFDADEPGAACG